MKVRPSGWDESEHPRDRKGRFIETDLTACQGPFFYALPDAAGFEDWAAIERERFRRHRFAAHADAVRHWPR